MGRRFHPTDMEVIKYLVGFAIAEPLPGQDQVMQVVDVYAEKEPWQIAEGKTGYFITPLKKKKDHHRRYKRSVGDNGTWKSQDKAKEVFDNKGRLMGYVHHLKYTRGSSKACPNKSSKSKELFGEWLMTEYSLYDGYVRDINKKIINTGFAICKIKKKKQKKSENEDQDMTMSEVEFKEFINSVLQEEDTDHQDVGDEVLALLGCNNDADEECRNLEENGASTSHNDHDQLDAVNSIVLEDYDFE